MDRLEAAIIILTYLTSGQFLFQYANFRDVIWQKMCEFETGVHDELERIHRISNLEEYKKEELRCSYLYDLRFAIFQLREILRGTNDQTFNQG